VPDFSDYIVFVDESGSPVLDGVDPTFPVFVLACLLVRKDHYADEIVPSLQKLKFEFVGHDQLILHERDIRRQQKDFAFLQLNQDTRTRFLEKVNALVQATTADVVAAIINKPRLQEKYADPWSPYEIALFQPPSRWARRALHRRASASVSSRRSSRALTTAAARLTVRTSPMAEMRTFAEHMRKRRGPRHPRERHTRRTSAGRC
jgi:hypothetical protein